MLIDKINILNTFLNRIFIIVLIILLLYIYYRLKYQFWSRQPVFHYHNLWYWLIPPGIIQHEKPKKNKYYNSLIQFDSFDKLKTEKKALFSSFIKSHFSPHKREKYSPTNKSISDNFMNHIDKSFISLFFKKTHNGNILVSTMTTKPLECKINNNDIKLHYVDFLCVHNNKRKQGIAPETIYSHYYNHRLLHKNTIFLFKREGDSTFIVPLSAYKNYGFDITYWRENVEFDQPYIKTELINGSSINIIIDILLKLEESFECVIKPNINHIKYFCDTDNLYIYSVLINNTPVCLYFYRNTHTTYDGKKSMELIGSYSNTSDDIFLLGFFSSLSKLKKISPIKILFIENISNNNIILKRVFTRHIPFAETNASYYFYNFAHHPYKSTNLFILN